MLAYFNNVQLIQFFCNHFNAFLCFGYPAFNLQILEGFPSAVYRFCECMCAHESTCAYPIVYETSRTNVRIFNVRDSPPPQKKNNTFILENKLIGQVLFALRLYGVRRDFLLNQIGFFCSRVCVCVFGVGT